MKLDVIDFNEPRKKNAYRKLPKAFVVAVTGLVAQNPEKREKKIPISTVQLYNIFGIRIEWVNRRFGCKDTF